jgi:N-acetyl-gamma-glutamyl-phosphate reductase
MKISIIGAGGLTGKELISLLKNHPMFDLSYISSSKTEGKTLMEVFPDIGWDIDLKFVNHDMMPPKDSIVVLAVPNEVSLEMAEKLLKNGFRVIDLSGSYRLHNKELFERYYNLKHNSFSIMEKVVYGMPEIFREQIKKADFVSNPGCYATSVILPIYMLGELRNKIQGSVIVSAASGVSGAGGRTGEVGFTFTNTYENFKAYKILNHQHTPEMEEYSFYGVRPKNLIFTPHLLPLYRGILSTIVIQFDEKLDQSIISKEFEKFDKELFLRRRNTPEEIELKNIQNSNFLDYSFRIKDQTLVIISALDNLVKGAAGQALQNLNLMCGFNENLGLLRS